MLSDKNLTVYENWNINYPAAPTRSRLFPLEPIGLGTPYLESLTSYLTRLAEAHTVLVGDLVAKEIKTIVPKKYKSRDLFCTKHPSGTANSMGTVARYLLFALENLTLREDLKSLTFLRWSEVMPHKNLIHPTKMWCPVCYQEQYEANQIIYDPLIWFLKPVEICPIHHVSLESQCLHCQKSLPALARNSRTGYCNYCENWLGSRKLSKSFIDPWNLWIVNSIGEIIDNTDTKTKLITRGNISKSFQICINQISEGEVASFAKLIGFPKHQVWEWANGKVIPQLSILLKVTYLIEVSLSDFLLGANFEPSYSLLKAQYLKQHKPPKINQVADLETAEQFLKTILSDSSTSQLSMSEVAKQLGFHRRTLTRKFPQLTHQISVRYLENKKKQHTQKIQEYCSEVEKAVVQLNEQGVYPSEANVSKLISKPGNFRDKKVRDALKKARRKLGIK